MSADTWGSGCVVTRVRTFVRDDGGRATSKRPKQRRDCVVRAIAIAAERPYDDVYEKLADAGRKCGRSTAKSVWQTWLDQLARKTSFPAEKGSLRMNLERFCQTHDRGRYVVQCAHHVLAVVDGVARDDDVPRWDACVYAAWLAKP
jgi:hypothetical protein